MHTIIISVLEHELFTVNQIVNGTVYKINMEIKIPEFSNNYLYVCMYLFNIFTF